MCVVCNSARCAWHPQAPYAGSHCTQGALAYLCDHGSGARPRRGIGHSPRRELRGPQDAQRRWETPSESGLQCSVGCGCDAVAWSMDVGPRPMRARRRGPGTPICTYAVRRSGEVKGRRREIRLQGVRTGVDDACVEPCGGGGYLVRGEHIYECVCEFVFWLRARMVRCAGSRTVRELPRGRDAWVFGTLRPRCFGCECRPRHVWAFAG